MITILLVLLVAGLFLPFFFIERKSFGDPTSSDDDLQEPACMDYLRRRFPDAPI